MVTIQQQFSPDTASDPLFDVRDKVVLVTGGSRGIGEMIARAFVERGAEVIITSRKAAVCNQVATELNEVGLCHAVPADIATEEGIAAVKAGVKKIASKLDVIVNNAGATWGAKLEEFPEQGWTKTLDVNLKAPFFLIQALHPLLSRAASKDNPSRIINIASIDGIRPPAFDSYAYSASKAGILMLTRHLAKHLAHEHILVNAIAPGYFRTKMTEGVMELAGDRLLQTIPLGRIGEHDDMAGVVIFLASRASGYLSGTTICCDGGVSGT